MDLRFAESRKMDKERAVEELKVIRQLMERPIRYSTMSGLSGVLAGCVALAGLFADAMVCSAFGIGTAMWMNMCVWACVFLVTLSAVLGLTRFREVRQGMPFWSPIKRKILMTIMPAFVAGAGLTAAIVFRWYSSDGPNEFGLVAPIWMLFYGVACWQVGELSVPEVRVLGAAFILAGLLSAAFFQATIPGLPYLTAPYWTLGASFGGFHIIYGLFVWAKYGG